MAVNLGSSNISTIKLGSTDVSKIYLGSDIVFGGQLQSLYSYRMTTSSYVRMYNYPAIDFNNTTTYTFGFVVKLNDLGVNNQALISNTDIDNLNGLFATILATGNITFQWRYEPLVSRKQVNFSGTTLTVGNWYTILFQVDPQDINNWQCLVNNVVQTPSVSANSASLPIIGKPLDFGATSDGTRLFVELDYNQVVIWDRALTTQEKTDFYNSGQPDFNIGNSDQILRLRFDPDVWDATNSRFNVINDSDATGGVTVNIVEVDKVISSPY